MKSAKDGRRYGPAHVLDRAIPRSLLVQSPVRPQLIIVGGILRQNPAYVGIAQDNYMVDALRRIDPISLSAKPAAMGVSLAPRHRR
jgi:hypothetical protein